MNAPSNTPKTTAARTAARKAHAGTSQVGQLISPHAAAALVALRADLQRREDAAKARSAARRAQRAKGKAKTRLVQPSIQDG